MFREALRNIVENTDGGVAGLIMDSEGISVDVYARDGAPFDITTIGIEFGVVLGSIRRAAESLEAGQPRVVAIATDKMVTLIRTLGDNYFLALALRPEGNLGKGRYLMRTAAPTLLAELG
jgi:predicted regulator of Ras-like GTPase activity (Roadblock/LC7/MglB family)